MSFDHLRENSALENNTYLTHFIDDMKGSDS